MKENLDFDQFFYDVAAGVRTNVKSRGTCANRDQREQGKTQYIFSPLEAARSCKLGF